MINLLDDILLEQSWVVANSLMNRERTCVGGNSYSRELSFHPIDFLKARLLFQEQVSWLDLCCGTGKALIEAGQILMEENLDSKIKLVGVDLVAMFDSQAESIPFLSLNEASLTNWFPDQAFDLITCVHGLHYIGNKLELIQNAVSWLTENGVFIANFDLTSLHFSSQPNAEKTVLKDLKMKGFEYQSKNRLLICRGRKTFELKYKYLGADDKAGANYTNQPAVNAYYEAIL